VTPDTAEDVLFDIELLISIASCWPAGLEYVHEIFSGEVIKTDVGTDVTGSADAKSHSSSVVVAIESAVLGVWAGFAARMLAGWIDCWYWNGEACREDSDFDMLANGSSLGPGCCACGGALYAGGAAPID
jgi:hypothetical protein